MIENNNSFFRDRELSQKKLNTEKKSIEIQNANNQTQMGRIKFQDIADQRYDAGMSQLTGNKFDPQAMLERAKKNKKALDAKRDELFLKKWQ